MKVQPNVPETFSAMMQPQLAEQVSILKQVLCWMLAYALQSVCLSWVHKEMFHLWEAINHKTNTEDR